MKPILIKLSLTVFVTLSYFIWIISSIVATGAGFISTILAIVLVSVLPFVLGVLLLDHLNKIFQKLQEL